MTDVMAPIPVMLTPRQIGYVWGMLKILPTVQGDEICEQLTSATKAAHPAKAVEPPEMLDFGGQRRES